MTRRLFCLLLLLGCTLLYGLRAQAAPDAEGAEGADYKRAIDSALEEYKLSHFEEARSLFERAHGIDPNARTLRGLGMVEFELRHYLRAQELLQQALSSTKKPLTTEQQTSVQALLERTRQFIARFTLELVPSLPSAKIVVDGEPAQLAPDGVLSLEAGEHTLQLTAPGFAPRELLLDAQGGNQQTLRVELQADAPQLAAPTEPPAPSPLPPERQRPYRKHGIVLVSVGAVAIATGSVLGGLALARADRSEQREDSDGQLAHTLGVSTDAVLAVGIASAIAGSICLLYRRDVRPDPKRSSAHSALVRGIARLDVQAVFPMLRVSF
jgi:hypothetical protein